MSAGNSDRKMYVHVVCPSLKQSTFEKKRSKRLREHGHAHQRHTNFIFSLGPTRKTPCLAQGPRPRGPRSRAAMLDPTLICGVLDWLHPVSPRINTEGWPTHWQVSSGEFWEEVPLRIGYHWNFLITNLIPQEFIFVIDVIALRHKFP